MKTHNFILSIVCLAVSAFAGHAQANVEFKKSLPAQGKKMTCLRDGVLIYELFTIQPVNSPDVRLYEFYWKGKKAIELHKFGKTAIIETRPMTEVSYSMDLDFDGELRGVTIQDGNGKTLDKLLRKKDGQLWPIDPLPAT